MANNKYTIVTSTSKPYFDDVARWTLPTWKKHLSEELYKGAEIYSEHSFPLQSKAIRPLARFEPYTAYLQNYGAVKPSGEVPPGHQFRFRHLPFACKVFSLLSTFQELYDYKVENQEDLEDLYLVWLDADAFICEDVDDAYFDKLLEQHGNPDILWMDRQHSNWYAIESGFLIFRVTPAVADFLDVVNSIYSSGTLFKMQEWHDGWIFSVVRDMYLHMGHMLDLKFASLVPPDVKDSHVMEHTPLHPTFRHLKGPEAKAKLQMISQMVMAKTEDTYDG